MRRAEIRAVGPSEIEIIPLPGQLPLCLVFTESSAGVLRQLTMPDDDLSLSCEAGSRVGDVTYRIPPKEGKVRIYVVFSDRTLKASSIAQKLNELYGENKVLTGLDLRAPGQVTIETLEFTPGS